MSHYAYYIVPPSTLLTVKSIVHTNYGYTVAVKIT